MTSSARPAGLPGSQGTQGTRIRPENNSRVHPGQRMGTSTATVSLPEQPRIPTRTVVPSNQNTINTAEAGARKGNPQERKASLLVPRKVSSHLKKKESRPELTTSSSLPADRSKAFIAAATSGSQIAWVPHQANNCIEVAQAGNGPFIDPNLWRRGPADPSGVVLDLCDRPLLCMSVRGTEAAVGSSDHGVYVVDVASQKLQRNLYGKKFGHVDWVTCVDFVGDGRIVSGGMDNNLCLWDATGVRCTNLTGHTASISGVKVIDRNYGISCSYDKTLLLWKFQSPQTRKPVGCLQGHKGAVLDFAMNSEGGIVSGSRDGEVFLWDGREGRAVLRCKTAHDGHVTAVECLNDANEDNAPNGSHMLFLTGGQDGVLQVWDQRTKAPVQTISLSRSAKGKGAITDIAVTAVSPGGPPLVIAASADKTLKVLEPRSSFQNLYVVDDHTDFIYSLYACGSLLWSGAGNGNILVHDLTDGNCLYGLGATSNGAPRCISLVGPRALVVAGDDGNCMIYSV